MLRALLCRLLGRHEISQSEWEYSPLDGMVDAYCRHCGCLVKRVPLDEWPWKEHVLQILEAARSGTRSED